MWLKRFTAESCTIAALVLIECAVKMISHNDGNYVVVITNRWGALFALKATVCTGNAVWTRIIKKLKSWFFCPLSCLNMQHYDVNSFRISDLVMWALCPKQPSPYCLERKLFPLFLLAVLVFCRAATCESFGASRCACFTTPEGSSRRRLFKGAGLYSLFQEAFLSVL